MRSCSSALLPSDRRGLVSFGVPSSSRARAIVIFATFVSLAVSCTEPAKAPQPVPAGGTDSRGFEALSNVESSSSAATWPQLPLRRLGTLGGYSTIWLARGLGAKRRVVTLEVDPKHAEIARLNFSRAGLQDVVELRIGNALETLPQLSAERRGPFDFIFIDADKENIPAYFDWALKLSRPGTLIVVDNVVRDGAVIDPDSNDPRVQGVRRFIEQLSTDSRASGTAIQTVGIKGYDGFAIVLVSPQ